MHSYISVCVSCAVILLVKLWLHSPHTHGSSLEDVSHLPSTWLCSLFLWLLQFFTCVYWGILPSTNLADRADYSFMSLRFFFFLFFYISLFWNLEICFYLFLLFFLASFSALYLVHPILFYSSFCSLFCLFTLCLFTLFSDLPYCFLFKSAILSFLFSYYSILPASPLCYIAVQFVLFLLELSICYFFAAVFFILLFCSCLLLFLVLYMLLLFLLLIFIFIIFLVLYFVCIALLFLPTD